MCVHDSARGQVRAVLSFTARVPLLVGPWSLYMCTCACETSGKENTSRVAAACARSCVTVCAFVRREICYRKRTETMWVGGEQLFFYSRLCARCASVLRVTDGLLRVGVVIYPNPVPHHCAQTEIYAHCRKEASIH